MNDYKDLMQHAPLAAFGMIVGQADLLLQSTPMIVKVMTVALAVSAGYYDLKTDLAVIHTEEKHAAEERGLFMDFMLTGERCTFTECNEIKDRIGRLESKYFN